MMEENIQELVVKIYQEVMDEPEEIDIDKELEWDSFDKMRFVLRFEEKTGKSMDDILLEVIKAEMLRNIMESAERMLNF